MGAKAAPAVTIFPSVTTIWSTSTTHRGSIRCRRPPSHHVVVTLLYVSRPAARNRKTAEHDAAMVPPASAWVCSALIAWAASGSKKRLATASASLRPSPGTSQIERSDRGLFGRMAASILRPLLSVTVFSVEHTRHRGAAHPALFARAAALDRMSKVAPTPEAKAPGRTKIV